MEGCSPSRRKSMAFVAITKDGWRTVTTTDGDTLIQNRSPQSIYLTVADTTGLDRDEGILIEPNASIVFGDGQAVKAYSPNTDGKVYVSAIGAVA
jgi:hypothetical protein